MNLGYVRDLLRSFAGAPEYPTFKPMHLELLAVSRFR